MPKIPKRKPVNPMLRANMPKYRTFTPEDSKNALCCLVLASSLITRHDTLKYTPFYSASLENSLDSYSRHKITMIFEGEDGRPALAQAEDIINVHERLLNIMVALHEQPESVQKRFNSRMRDIGIECGIPLSVLDAD